MKVKRVSFVIHNKPFPTQLGFCKRGDFWKVPKDGQLATRETNCVIRRLEPSVTVPHLCSHLWEQERG